MHKKAEEFIEKHKYQQNNWQYKQHKDKIDIIINLFMLCPERSLSNIVTSIDVLLQKFENPKSSALVKFIESSTFIKEGNENFMIIEDVTWDES